MTRTPQLGEQDHRRRGAHGRQPRAASKEAVDFPVVAIGASAGGLEAFRILLGAFPAKSGMAFILVQHLDPDHASMIVELLSPHVAMTMVEARDGMPLEPD
ncbi:MAG: chemotaxis protein CheB, partial [Devosia sp.]|nr:chemotaxis protein CheB [Devosia sp.]